MTRADNLNTSKITENDELNSLYADILSDNIVKNSPSTQRNSLKFYIFSDIIALFLAVSCSWVSALTVNNLFIKNDSLFLSNIYNSTHIISFLLVSAGVLVWFAHNRHYSVRMPFWIETQKIIGALGFALLVDGFLQFASKQDISRLLIISSWIFAGFTIIALRAIVRFVAIKRGTFQIPTLLVGSGITAHQIQTALKSAPEMGYTITAQVKNLPEEFLQAGSSWKNLCNKHEVQHVVIALDGKDFQGTDIIMKRLARESISYSVAPALQNLPVTGMLSHHFLNHNAMLLTHSCGIDQTLPQLIKRTFDILLSAFTLLLLSPIMLVIAAFIKLDGGPSLFGHKRLGRGGKIFPCLKFRTMVMNGDEILKEHLKNNPEAEAEWKATQKLQNDPRVTRFGKFLRGSSLDELPQLINVLKGDMSLVGPRPIVRSEIEHYDHDIAHYYRVRPGVTGLWQVSGRNDVSYAERVQMDSWYVRNWSLWHDIAIICKTFPAVFKRSGAY